METDTAVVYGGLGGDFNIFVAGQLQSGNGNKYLLSLGGQFPGNLPTNDPGLDWGDFGADASLFNGHGAVLFVSVGNADSVTLKVEDQIAFASYDGPLQSNSNPNPLNWIHSSVQNHDPVKLAEQYLFFDIGDFIGNETLYNFVDETLNGGYGQQKELTVSGASEDAGWIHIDVLALATDDKKNTTLVSTSIANNPFSHDVTWKVGGPLGGPLGAPAAVPEPASIALWAVGLVMSGGVLRRRRMRAS